MEINQKDSSNSVFIHKFLKAIADSIIKLFIPLYILKTTGNLQLSFAYLSFYSLFVLFFMFILKKFIQKYGILAIILHFIPIVATEAILTFCKLNFLIVIICSSLMALTQALYSIPLNLIFAFQDKKTNVAKFQVASNIGKLVFILISGFIISSEIKNSFLILSICSTIIYVLCVLPICSSYSILKEKYNRVNIEKSVKFSKNKEFTLFHIGFGCFQATMDNIVPLFLYVNNLSFKAVTIIISLIELLKIVFNYLAKFLIKKKREKVSCFISAGMFFVSLICIIFVKNNLALYLFSCVCSVCFPLTFVPMFKIFCNDVNSEGCTIGQTTKRDFDIFSLRPIFHGAYYVTGFYGCFACGIASLILMLASEIKILSLQKTNQNVNENLQIDNKENNL